VLLALSAIFSSKDNCAPAPRRIALLSEEDATLLATPQPPLTAPGGGLKVRSPLAVMPVPGMCIPPPICDDDNDCGYCCCGGWCC
jgi:hypothetical protein